MSENTVSSLKFNQNLSIIQKIYRITSNNLNISLMSLNKY